MLENILFFKKINFFKLKKKNPNGIWYRECFKTILWIMLYLRKKLRAKTLLNFSLKLHNRKSFCKNIFSSIMIGTVGVSVIQFYVHWMLYTRINSSLPHTLLANVTLQLNSISVLIKFI